jgi:LPS-assembly lipoprotein
LLFDAMISSLSHYRCFASFRIASLRIALVVLLVSFSLSSCGFRLAGTNDLPPELSSIYLVTSNISKVQIRALQRSLENAGATVVSQLDQQSVQLKVSLKVAPDRQLATSARDGAIVRRISRGLTFSVKAADGQTIAATQTLRQQKDVSLNDDNLQASNREQETVTRELEQSLFDQLVRQLTRI